MFNGCNMTRVLACGSSMLCVPMAFAETVSATPSRPSVSSSAQLSAPGYFEIESGYQKIKGSDGATRTSFPTRLKYSFSENIGLLLDHELAVGQHGMGSNIRGEGDTALWLKLKLPSDGKDTTAFGLEAGVIAPTAKDGLGVDKTAYLVNGIVSTELGGFSVDINLGALHLGSVGAGESHNGWSWAAAASRELTEKWGVTGEFSGAGRRGAATQSQALTALTYKLSNRVVLDAGMAWGINQAAPDWTAFGGIAVLLGEHRAGIKAVRNPLASLRPGG